MATGQKMQPQILCFGTCDIEWVMGHTVCAWLMFSIANLYAFSVSMHLGVVTDGF